MKTRRPDRTRPPRSRSPEPREPESARQIIYGVLPVTEALKAETRRIERVLVLEGAREHRLQEIMDACRSHSIPFDRLAREAFVRHVNAEVNHQGVAAVIAAAGYVESDEILDNPVSIPLIVVLDGVEDPRNLGAQY